MCDCSSTTAWCSPGHTPILTSPPFDMFTTSHEKEEGLPKTMRLQARKGKVKKGSGTQIKSNLI